VRDRWGIFHAHPIVLNERQVGTAIEPSSHRAIEPSSHRAIEPSSHRAIEGVVRQEHIETA
jgi:hypothetical protein